MTGNGAGKAFRERDLEVTFDESWECEKWDDCQSYRAGIGKLQGTDAVDFVGIRGGTLYFIEVKGLRDYRIEARNRHQTLPDEIALKVRDTIAGVVGASIMRKDDEFSRKCAEIIGRSRDEQRIRVVAWIIEDRVVGRKDRIRAGVRRKAVVSKLRWLTSKVWDTNPLEDPRIEGVGVRLVGKDEA